jgi:hypothetical protein
MWSVVEGNGEKKWAVQRREEKVKEGEGEKNDFW